MVQVPVVIVKDSNGTTKKKDLMIIFLDQDKDKQTK